MKTEDLVRKLDDKPFRPFRIRLVNNTTYDVVDPGMIIIGDSSAVIAIRNIRDESGHYLTTDWRTVSIAHMLEFSDLEVKPNGSKRKK
jgi:hypothetical protein